MDSDLLTLAYVAAISAAATGAAKTIHGLVEDGFDYFTEDPLRHLKDITVDSFPVLGPIHETATEGGDWGKALMQAGIQLGSLAIPGVGAYGDALASQLGNIMANSALGTSTGVAAPTATTVAGGVGSTGAGVLAPSVGQTTTEMANQAVGNSLQTLNTPAVEAGAAAGAKSIGEAGGAISSDAANAVTTKGLSMRGGSGNTAQQAATSAAQGTKDSGVPFLGPSTPKNIIATDWAIELNNAGIGDLFNPKYGTLDQQLSRHFNKPFKALGEATHPMVGSTAKGMVKNAMAGAAGNADNPDQIGRGALIGAVSGSTGAIGAGLSSQAFGVSQGQPGPSVPYVSVAARMGADAIGSQAGTAAGAVTQKYTAPGVPRPAPPTPSSLPEVWNQVYSPIRRYS